MVDSQSTTTSNSCRLLQLARYRSLVACGTLRSSLCLSYLSDGRVVLKAGLSFSLGNEQNYSSRSVRWLNYLTQIK